MDAFEVAGTLPAHEADGMMLAPFVARNWYGEQGSALYALASSGTMVAGLAAEARRAAEAAQDPEQAEVLAVLARVAYRLGF